MRWIQAKVARPIVLVVKKLKRSLKTDQNFFITREFNEEENISRLNFGAKAPGRQPGILLVIYN